MAKYTKLKQEILSKKDCPHIMQDDGVVHLNINTSAEILSPYRENNQPLISGEFAQFLENSVKDISVKQDLVLEINCSNACKDLIAPGIKNYYYNQFVESERNLKRNLLFSLTSLLAGIIVLLLTNIFQYYDLSFVLTNTLDILAWVFVWEAFDLFFFRRTEYKYIQYRQMNFINAKIILK